MIKKKKRMVVLILFLIALSGCIKNIPENPVKHVIFSAEELNQISVTSDGGMKYFIVPNKSWSIGAYLPDYNIIKHDFTIFQASRHYNGEHLITVVTSLIDPETKVNDLESCLDYRKTHINDIESFNITKEGDKTIITKEDQEMSTKLTIILQFYDSLCIDTMIATTQLTQESIEDTNKIINSIKIIPANSGPEIIEPAKVLNQEKPKISPNKYRDKAILHIEGEDWVTLIKLSGFENITADIEIPSRFFFKQRKSDNLLISAFAEIISYLPALVGSIPDMDETDICWAHYISQMGIDPKIKTEERNGMIIMPQIKGNMKSMNAYVYHEGYCFDFHISQTPYINNDAFYEIFDSIEFKELKAGENIGTEAYVIPSITIP